MKTSTLDDFELRRIMGIMPSGNFPGKWVVARFNPQIDVFDDENQALEYARMFLAKVPDITRHNFKCTYAQLKYGDLIPCPGQDRLLMVTGVTPLEGFSLVSFNQGPDIKCCSTNTVPVIRDLNSRPLLHWDKNQYGEELAVLGVLGAENDGVLFTLGHYPTCYRRGPYRLIIEIPPGPHHHDWGCFDDQDQPMRWFHSKDNAKSESELIAQVLWRDRFPLPSLF
jgi:hypothetical protein